MEGDGHDAVGGVEGLLNSVPVVNVNVDVQHPLVVPAGSTGTLCRATGTPYYSIRGRKPFLCKGLEMGCGIGHLVT